MFEKGMRSSRLLHARWAGAAAALGLIVGSGVLLPSTAVAAVPGTAEAPSSSAGQSASGAVVINTYSVHASVSVLPGGGQSSTYRLKDGQVLTVPTPPDGFNPLTASSSELAAYDFPPEPAGEADRQAWEVAMAAYRSDDPPPAQFSVAEDGSVHSFGTTTHYYSNWAGYTAGTWGSQSHTYVAVKADLTVPSTGSCNFGNETGFWIGLGGTAASPTNDLVQQGVECGDPSIGAGGSFRPFTEFAETFGEHVLCGQSSWTLPAGHVIYQNMSFQTSSSTAYFYLEDETSGVAHSCSETPSSGWSFDGNTADWVAEAPNGYAVSFGSVPFTDAEAELGSTGAWVTLGSRGTIYRLIIGSSASDYCIGATAIGSDNASFSTPYSTGNC